MSTQDDDLSAEQIKAMRDWLLCKDLQPARPNGARRPGRGGARLTEDEVREIRYIRSAFNLPLKFLADEYGVSYQAISNIITRRTWKDV